MNDTTRSRWYQEPLMGLVVGIPLATVVAGFTTLWLAVSRPDPVVAEAGTPLVLVASGLSADTAYRYRVRYRSPGVGAWLARPEHGFRTQRPRGSTFVFDIQADPHLDSNTNPDLYRRTLSNILADAPDFLVELTRVFEDADVGYLGGRILLHNPDDAPVSIRLTPKPWPIPAW
mgnify:CR=1 FL=1